MDRILVPSPRGCSHWHSSGLAHSTGKRPIRPRKGLYSSTAGELIFYITSGKSWGGGGGGINYKVLRESEVWLKYKILHQHWWPCLPFLPQSETRMFNGVEKDCPSPTEKLARKESLKVDEQSCTRAMYSLFLFCFFMWVSSPVPLSVRSRGII